MNQEKIHYFFDRMRLDSRFRNYYLSVYDALRILHRRIFYEPSVVVVQSEEHWSSKVEIALDDEHRGLKDVKRKLSLDRQGYLGLSKYRQTSSEIGISGGKV